jgi:UDP:flavonoid glycosyltransferase YjiC (YdhE family)
VTWDGGGNTTPEFHLGTRLVRRGHRVRLLGWESMAEGAAAAGLEFTPYASMHPLPENITLDDLWDSVDVLLHGPSIRDDILAEAGAFAPDVLVLDCLMGAGFAAARQLRLPVAVITHVLYAAFVDGWGDDVMHTSVAGLLAGADRVLVLVPRGFDTPTALPANTTYVGPNTRVQSRGRCGGLADYDLEMIAASPDPWVLLSLSTTLQGQAEALPAMLAAVASLPLRVLLTLGGVMPIESIDAPSNVTVRDYVPHDMVLPHMSAVISHGGLSTITAALAAGVPLVCIPQGREQPLNAARVEVCGAGRVVAPDAPVAVIATAVDAVVRDVTARAAARRLAAEIAALGGGDLATAMVEQLAVSPRTAGEGRLDAIRSSAHRSPTQAELSVLAGP